MRTSIPARASRARWAVGLAGVLLLGAACGGEEPEAPRGQPRRVAAAEPAVAVRTVADTAPRPAEPTPPVARVVTYEEAEAAFRTGDYEEAARLFGWYAEQKPENAWGHYMHGLASWKTGDRGTAERSLARAAELHPDNMKVRVNLGRVLLESGRAAEAEPHLVHAVDLRPDSEDAWRVLGNVQAELGRGEEAEASYMRALGLNAEDAWTMNNLGLLKIRLGRYEEALPPLARAVELRPGSPVFQNNLGIALERSGYLVTAADAYRLAVAADSTYVKAATSLARVEPLAGQSRPDTADLTAMAREFAEELAVEATGAVIHPPGS